MPSYATWKRKENYSRSVEKVISQVKLEIGQVDQLFYRHSYSFFLEWEEMEKLATSLAEVWSQAKRELQLFLDSLSIKR